MIDLTPLEVRKKKGDFRRGLRGYDAPQVDDFLDIVADRLETVVRENASFHDRIARLEQQVTDYREREKALTEALVTAQEMREEMRAQSAREADLARRHAEQDAARIRAEAAQLRDREEDTLRRLRARQLQFLNTYRAFLERELSELESIARGLELNGAMAETPEPRGYGEPKAGEAAQPPATASRPGPASRMTVRPAPAAEPAIPAATPEPPRPAERTAFAAGIAGASVRPSPPSTPPPSPSSLERPPLSEWSGKSVPEARTPADTWSTGKLKEASPGTDEWGPPPREEPRTAPADSWETTPPAESEAELILSDDDVLADPDLEADMDLLFGGGAAPSAPKATPDSPFGAEFGPPASAGGTIGLDLVPDFDDFTAFGSPEPPAASGSSAAKEAKEAPRPGQTGGKTQPGGSQAKDAGDDPEDLLSSLFGNDH